MINPVFVQHTTIRVQNASTDFDNDDLIFIHMFWQQKTSPSPLKNMSDKDEVSRGTTLLLVSCHKKSSFRRNTTRNFLFSAPLPTHLGFICTVSFRRIHHTQLVWRETKLNAFTNWSNFNAKALYKSRTCIIYKIKLAVIAISEAWRLLLLFIFRISFLIFSGIS